MGIFDLVKRELFYNDVRDDLGDCILCVADYLACDKHPDTFKIPNGNSKHYDNMVKCLDVAIKQSQRPKESEGFKILRDRYEALSLSN